MYHPNNIENLELKLKNAQEENTDHFKQAKQEYEQNYKDFVDSFFANNSLGATKNISSYFQLEYFNTLTSKTEISEHSRTPFSIALEKSVAHFPLSGEKKSTLIKQFTFLETQKNKTIDSIKHNTEFTNDHNYPIIIDLKNQTILHPSDIISIADSYKKNQNIKLSLTHISKEKREVILSYYNTLNSTDHQTKESEFTQEYSTELIHLQSEFSGPIIDGVVSFVGRNFFKLKPYKKSIESKKNILRRTFKIALLKMLRIRYSGFNVEKLLQQIDSLDDFESMFRLIQKLIDIIPENSEVVEQFSIQEQIDVVDEIINEAESNSEKIHSGEELTLKICSVIGETEKKIDTKTLDKILEEGTDIVGNEVLFRGKNEVDTMHVSTLQNGANLLDGESKIQINAGILSEEKNMTPSDTEDNILIGEEELEQKYQEIKLEYTIAEKKKQLMFASGDFDSLDEINDDILSIMIKLEKISSLIGEDE